MKAVLKVSNPAQSFCLELKKGQKISLGRGSNAQGGQVSDEKVSSKHCLITLYEDYLKVTDTDSKNGVYLNGIRVEDAEVFMGDEVRIGDSIIILDESQMDADSIEELTFPGPKKNRISHELRMDFTGARIQNQAITPNPDSVRPQTPSQAKEIALRKRAQTQIKLSRHEIRSRNTQAVNTARIIDTVLLVIVAIAPFVYINMASDFGGIPFLGLTAEMVSSHKGNLIGAAELFFTGMFLIFNTRLMEFSIGEKLCGIESKYNAQDD